MPISFCFSEKKSWVYFCSVCVCVHPISTLGYRNSQAALCKHYSKNNALGTRKVFSVNKWRNHLDIIITTFFFLFNIYFEKLETPEDATQVILDKKQIINLQINLCWSKFKELVSLWNPSTLLVFSHQCVLQSKAVQPFCWEPSGVTPHHDDAPCPRQYADTAFLTDQFNSV